MSQQERTFQPSAEELKEIRRNIDELLAPQNQAAAGADLPNPSSTLPPQDDALQQPSEACVLAARSTIPAHALPATAAAQTTQRQMLPASLMAAAKHKRGSPAEPTHDEAEADGLDVNDGPKTAAKPISTETTEMKKKKKEAEEQR
jgi:hypothetical protein